MKLHLGLLFLALALTGCITPHPPGFGPVKSVTTRVEAYGFSVLPPARDWIQGKNNYGVIFGRKVNATDSYHAGLSVTRQTDLKDREAFYAFARKKLTEGSDSFRYRMVRNDVAESEKDGLLLAVGRVDFDDTGAINVGKNEFLATRTATILGWDPKDPERLVAVWYSWRGVKFDETRFAQDATRFLDSLQRAKAK